MRLKVTALALCAGLVLVGCAHTVTDPITGTTTQQPDPQLLDTINKVKAGVLQACGYSATINSIAAIVGTFVPGVSIVGQVTGAICSSVTALGARYGGAGPTVNGVPVEGHFVQGRRR